MRTIKSFARLFVGTLICLAGSRVAAQVQNTTTTYAYDVMSNITQITDPLNHITKPAYDQLNRLTKLTDARNGTTQYGYDARDKLVKVTDARSLVANYTIDGLGNLTITASPDTGSTIKTYDEAGNLKTRTDAKGQIATYTYDVLNRVTAVSYSDGGSETYLYDQGANGIGRLSLITDSSGTTQYGYDVRGRVTSEVRGIGGQSYTTFYQYDAAGRLTGITYPGGRLVSYSYDGNGRISSISTTKDGTTTPLVSQVQYQPFGRLQSLVFGNGQTYVRSYDLDGRTTSYTLNGAVQTVNYDAASRLVGISDAAQPANNRTYGYDELNRLTSEQRATSSLGYNYDAVGNRTQKINGATSTSYGYASNSNRLTTMQGAPLASDANGAMTNNGAASLNYDARGRMVSANTVIGQVTYKINALGQRVQKVTPQSSTAFVYDQAGRLLAENDGLTSTEYVYLGITPVAVVSTNNAAIPAVFFVHTDHLDTPRKLIDLGGAVVWSWDGDAYGSAPPASQTNVRMSLRFPGQYADAESQLHYNYFRDYDPEVGRYVQSDPIGLEGGINTYTYVFDHPMRYVDPLGLQAIPVPVITPPSGGSVTTPGGVGGGYDPRTDMPIPPSTRPNFNVPSTLCMVVPTICASIIIANEANGENTPRGLPPSGIKPPIPEADQCTVGPASRPSEAGRGGKSTYDPSGGEWRWYPGDRWHNPHWDYNPHNSPSSP
jgi:RHS repeat-associated protein